MNKTTLAAIFLCSASFLSASEKDPILSASGPGVQVARQGEDDVFYDVEVTGSSNNSDTQVQVDDDRDCGMKCCSRVTCRLGEGRIDSNRKVCLLQAAVMVTAAGIFGTFLYATSTIGQDP